jgi:hypothetical protein
MAFRYTGACIFCLIFLTGSTQAQEGKKFYLKGYVKYLTSLNYNQPIDEWITDNLIHNRLELRYYPVDGLNFELAMRNRFFYGETIKVGNSILPGDGSSGLPSYQELLTRDFGFFNLSHDWASGNFYLLNTTIDRFFIDYTYKDWQFRFGRHRINWGQNLVWNPNDVFNAYSYFDFDYEERPGADAFRVQYYTSYTSSAEFVYQLGDSIDATSFMGLYRFNKWNYDFQFLGGFSKGDIVVGTGWAGDIEGAGFRGEVSYFHNADSIGAAEGQLVASVSADYTFKSSLYLHASYLYNSAGTTGKAGFADFNILALNQTSAKQLTRSRGSVFGQVGYQITPLLRGDLAAIANPYDKSFFVAPTLSYSLTDNIELFFIAQIFSGEEGTEFGDIGQFYNVRFKWSF